MNKSLAIIVQEKNLIEQMLIESCGELTPELEQALAISNLELPEKVDSYSWKMDFLKSAAEFYKEKAEFFSKVSKSLSSASDRMKDGIKDAMKALTVDEIQGNDIRFKLSKTKPRLIVENEEFLKDYFKEVKTMVLEKDKLTEDLKIGEVKGARLEDSFSLRTYANNSQKKIGGKNE